MPGVALDKESIRLISPCGLYSFHGERSGDKIAMAIWFEGKDYMSSKVSWEEVQNIANDFIKQGWVNHLSNK